VKLTPDDLQRLRTKQVANVIRKLNAGKTLTAREEALLAQERAEPTVAAPPPAAGFASTWEELAEACRVDRRTLTNVRTRFAKDPDLPRDRADGRREIAAWIAFLDAKGIRGRGDNNPEIDFASERQLRLRQWQLKLEREEFELAKARDEMLPVSQFEAALGQMLAAFRQSLDALAHRIAGNIDEADGDTLLKAIAAAKPKDLAALKKLIKARKIAFADYHARVALIDAEVELVKSTLRRCDYLAASDDGD
jgi:hypothetical protein